MNATTYQRLRDAGAEIDNHASDLYVRQTPDVRSIINAYRKEQASRQELPLMVEPFRSAIDGSPWLSLPFCFDPFWEARAAK